MSRWDIITGDCREVLKSFPDGHFHCCVTSPPYFGLRDYGTGTWEGGDAGCDHLRHDDLPSQFLASTGLGGGTASQGDSARAKYAYRGRCGKCGARRVDRQIGLEADPAAYVAALVGVMREVKRVLRDDGTVWLNLGDSYASSGASGRQGGLDDYAARERGQPDNGPKSSARVYGRAPTPAGLKPKDLLGIPWRVALALQEDGWFLRSDIIWCLSGGTWLYVKTRHSGVCLMTVKDLARLRPGDVQLWNGERWTRLLGLSKSARLGNEVELVLRSGERVACTPTHKFPTDRGLLPASQIRPGDRLQRCQLPEPERPADCALDEDAAWFVGLYLAEGSRSDDTIQISGHVRELDRLERVYRVARKFGGSAVVSNDGNKQAIRVYGKVLNALIDEFLTGRTARDKGLAPPVWRYGNGFLAALLDGYLSGDGHWDAGNKRWRLGFTRNYNLERDLRTLCARLGYRLILKPASVPYDGREVPTFRGEIRTERSGHQNEKDAAEVVEVRKARCRVVYDLGVADEPHLFALASGILTHNSKANPMPESVTDRPTKSHEYVFMLAKKAKYFYDAEAVREELAPASAGRYAYEFGGAKSEALVEADRNGMGVRTRVIGNRDVPPGRNLRSVWSINPEPFPGAHFAVMPTRLVARCVLAGTSERGCCSNMLKKLRLKRDLTPEQKERVARFFRAKRLPVPF